MKNRYDYKWRGKRLGDMNKEELIDALIESNTKLMDCKMALVRFDYDYDKALSWLKLGGHLKYTI